MIDYKISNYLSISVPEIRIYLYRVSKKSIKLTVFNSIKPIIKFGQQLIFKTTVSQNKNNNYIIKHFKKLVDI